MIAIILPECQLSFFYIFESYIIYKLLLLRLWKRISLSFKHKNIYTPIFITISERIFTDKCQINVTFWMFYSCDKTLND